MDFSKKLLMTAVVAAVADVAVVVVVVVVVAVVAVAVVVENGFLQMNFRCPLLTAPLSTANGQNSFEMMFFGNILRLRTNLTNFS